MREDLFMIYFPYTKEYLRSGKNFTIAVYDDLAVAKAQVTRNKGRGAVIVKIASVVEVTNE